MPLIPPRPAPERTWNWLDLLPIRDDRRILRNPHRGWYWHYIDQGYASPCYREPEHQAPDDDLRDFPGLNHLYLRFDWCDVEPARGKFDWSYLDQVMETWAARGYRFAFRACCQEKHVPYATPRWVRELGCGGTDVVVNADTGTTCWEPDYGHPVFLENLDAFLAVFAAKYDGHPLVEYVDVGSYGTYGEGHTWGGTRRNYPVETLKRHADFHARHFRKTPVLMNDDMVCVRPEDTDENKIEILRYFREKGFGIRDDSVCVPGVAEKAGYDTLRCPWIFDWFVDQAPVDIEFAHFHQVPPQILRTGLPFLAALQRTGATYAGFHGYPRRWLAEGHHDFTEFVANRLGYWYFADGIDLPPAVRSGVPFCVDLFWRNEGLARAYNRFGLTIRLEQEGGAAVHEQDGADVDNRRWMPGVTARERVRLDIPALPAGTYGVKVRLAETLVGGHRTVIQIGVKESVVDERGFAQVARIAVRT